MLSAFQNIIIIMRKKLISSVAAVLFMHSIVGFAKVHSHKANHAAKSDKKQQEESEEESASGGFAKSSNALYEKLRLGELGLSRAAYDLAMIGYENMLSTGKLSNEHFLSIIDFSLASAKKRLFILDFANKKLIFNTYVAHGRNSGREMAREFSNEPESYKSSLGFFITGDAYVGKHGFSLRLLGEEKGINDKADSRAIVMHSAPYVTEDAIKIQGFIGRSLGCPALPEALTKPIIETIKNGSCLFLYSPDKSYLANSTFIHKAMKA